MRRHDGTRWRKIQWRKMDELSQITQHLLRSSPDALIVIDDGGRIRFANDTVTELLGHRPEDLLNRTVDALVPERFRSRHERHIAGYLLTPTNREMGVQIAHLFALRADGSEFAADIRLAPFRVADKLFVAAAIRDNTERSRINSELIAAREEADRANRAKSRFLAMASHDLRQPLQAIRVLNAAMTKLADGQELGVLLRHQETVIESSIRLLNALLDISRLESGAIEPRRAAVSLPLLLEELRGEFDSIARARGLQLQVESLPLTVHTDRTLFHQLLQNLLGNAIKYTDTGSVSVKCRIAAEGELQIMVRDTGIGIPADKLERIFDEYYQVDTHGAKRFGVGLGLAIVKEVARLLGFEVAIASRVHESTEAVVSIPPQLFGAPHVADAGAGAVSTGMAGKRAGRIILVEDNEGVRVATELFLRLEGYETLSTASLAGAMDLLASIRPGDVVVADYHLDRTHTGLDVLAGARDRSGTQVPGVILSGDVPSVLRSIGTPMPATRFLGKPVDTRALLEAINELSMGSLALAQAAGLMRHPARAPSGVK